MGERESCNAPEVLHIGHPTAACGETGKNATAHSICGDCVQAVAFRLKAGRAAAQTMRDACTAVEHDLRASWDCCSTCRGRIEALDRLREYADCLDPQHPESGAPRPLSRENTPSTPADTAPTFTTAQEDAQP